MPERTYALVFNEEHFWNQHLAGTIVSLSSLEAAIYANVQEQMLQNNSYPEGLNNSQTFTFDYNNNGTIVPIEYRMFYVTNGSTAAQYGGGYISIGTVYIP